jgi:hypothetical protein
MGRDNAQSITFSNNKVVELQRTIGGYVSSHWGKELEVMSVSGSIAFPPGQESLGFFSLQILKHLWKFDKEIMLGKPAIYRKVLLGVNLAANIAMQMMQFAGNSSADIAGVLKGDTGIKNKGYTADIVVASAVSAISYVAYMTRLMKQPTSALVQTFIYHDGWIHEGYFTKFEYTRATTDFRRANYSFDFVITWSTEDMLANWLRDDPKNAISSVSF